MTTDQPQRQTMDPNMVQPKEEDTQKEGWSCVSHFEYFIVSERYRLHPADERPEYLTGPVLFELHGLPHDVHALLRKCHVFQIFLNSFFSSSMTRWSTFQNSTLRMAHSL